MKVFEVLNYFDHTRFFVSANSEEEMLELMDAFFVKRLEESKEDGEYFDEEKGEYQYDPFRRSKEKRLEEFSYTLLIEDAAKPSVNEHNLPGDVDKFYF